MHYNFNFQTQFYAIFICDTLGYSFSSILGLFGLANNKRTMCQMQTLIMWQECFNCQGDAQHENEYLTLMKKRISNLQTSFNIPSQQSSPTYTAACHYPVLMLCSDHLEQSSLLTTSLVLDHSSRLICSFARHCTLCPKKNMWLHFLQ